MKHNTPKTSSIEKALDIVMAFNPNNLEMGTMELSQELDFHPATVNRILKILTRKGFLQQNNQTRKFILGPSVFHLGKTIFQTISGNLLKFAVPYLEDLAEEQGMTAVLEVKSSRNSIVAYIAQGKSSYLIGPKIGERMPVHAAAGAKIMLAYCDPGMVDTYNSEKWKRFTSKTITDPNILKLELKKARKQGVAFCREEMAMGVNAIAAPVFNHDERYVASIVVVGLTSSLKCDIKSPVVAALKRTASKVSALNYHPESMKK
ncbi:MAG: IclR family transcriptional regulator [Deltaproteobacteria bacterium]|nr:IclR family transcriptional regulator [Deltaproteobacteria bacterium]